VLVAAYEVHNMVIMTNSVNRLCRRL
jgi:hypothetical protein